MIKRLSCDQAASAVAPPDVHNSALSALFGTSTGEVSSFIGTSAATSSSSGAPKYSSPLLDDSPQADGAKQESAAEEAAPKECKVVVVNAFDDLANFESLAAAQGVTEAEFMGDMTIIDASGKTYTWDTFSPAAEFPIKLQFTKTKQQRKEERSEEKKQVEQQQKIEEQKMASASEKRAKLGAAAQRRAAAAKAKGSSHLCKK
eukprot:TRINITY_DN503_c0_g1_i1.p1 TRINITY_DN503_c0_g1~~TRINITY_DN503_c0_g1_i1.p1  ORF type:complete len:203 (+),score=46.03 TRINITY_DN503_c0_g1_i1:84-692(+)